MAVETDIDEQKLNDEFERQFTKAQRRAARKVGTQIVRAQRKQIKRVFGNVSKRRLKAVQRYVPKGATKSRRAGLTIIDFSPGAEAHETGATIRPKSGQFLAIPTELGFEGTSSRAGQGGGRPRLQERKQAGETFVIRNNSGNLVVMRNVSSVTTQRRENLIEPGASAFPIATLVRSVRIPARLNMEETVRAHIPDYIAQIETELANAK